MNSRSARRIRAGAASGVCRLCRTGVRIRVTPDERLWARKTLAAMTDADRMAVELAFSPNRAGD